jgi:DNA-directed RNA polymerase specialized sigma subunit
MLLAIAEHYSRKPNWRGYSYREDMVASAMPFLCTAVFKFKVKKKTSAFSYMTCVAHNAFLQTLKKELKHARLNTLIRSYAEAIWPP